MLVYLGFLLPLKWQINYGFYILEHFSIVVRNGEGGHQTAIKKDSLC